ncbi:MAG: hypothetical protein K0S76_2945 [Herbinix sp.]|jgi:hypothetical protein|nr:hypothetical protein [Herbinix sp.]
MSASRHKKLAKRVSYGFIINIKDINGGKYEKDSIKEKFKPEDEPANIK